MSAKSDKEQSPPGAVPHFTVAERKARGRAARSEAARASHALLDMAADRDPIALLDAQASERVAALLPIRYGRMLGSPLAFFRGAATVMASDLASTPRAGLHAELCGDAHLLNFGGYASPERNLVFDLNDFDETLPGPFEWDVKRLAASVEIAGRDRGLADRDRRAAVVETVRTLVIHNSLTGTPGTSVHGGGLYTTEPVTSTHPGRPQYTRLNAPDLNREDVCSWVS